MLSCIANPHPHLHAHLEDGVLSLSLNRPDVKNAFNLELYSLLQHAFEQADQDKAVRVVILTGTDSNFSAGNDMKSFLELPEFPAPGQAGSTPPFMMLKAIAKFSKPCIAAVSGACIGVANTMLLHFDLVYADDSAIFQMPFVRLGLSLEGAASLLLAQRAGYHQAAEILFLAEKYDATKAHAAGMVNEIIDKPYECAQNKAQHLASLPIASLKAVKVLMKHNINDILKCIDNEAEFVMQRATSPEMFEAVSAFMQKRQPDFKQFH